VLTRNGDQVEEITPSRDVARAWLSRLKNLERVLAESNIDDLALYLAIPNLDAVPEATLRSNCAALLREIDNAKAYFGTLVDY
jgi:hypothetical protein